MFRVVVTSFYQGEDCINLLCPRMFDIKNTRYILCSMKITTSVKIDKDTKEKASKMAAELGLSLSSIINATLQQLVRTGELRLYISHQPTPYLEKLVLEDRKEYQEGKTSGPYNNVKDLMEHLDV